MSQFEAGLDPKLHIFMPNCNDNPLRCWACGHLEAEHVEVPFSEPSLEPSYNDLMLEKQRRKRR